MIHVNEIIEKLEFLRLNDPHYYLFGSSPEHGWGHAYIRYPPVPESKVRAFEEAAGVQLPEDYRAFITQVCNGGPGPGYGEFFIGDTFLRDYIDWLDSAVQEVTEWAKGNQPLL